MLVHSSRGSAVGSSTSAAREEVGTHPARRTALGLAVAGRVESAQLEGVEQVSCAYEFVSGADWKLRSGIESGETQPAHSRLVDDASPSVIWNFPLDVAFLSTNVSGWPRIAITVRDRDRNLVGYGAVSVPTRAGHHVRYCRLFAPLSSSVLGDTLAALTSDLPEFYDARFSTTCVGREAARVVSSGIVKVSLCTRVSGMEQLGYQ